MAHQFTTLRVDESNHVIETSERGVLVPVWNHRLRVEPVSPRECRYTDRIELKAGLLTPLVWLFVAAFYRYRQMRWRRLTTPG